MLGEPEELSKAQKLHQAVINTALRYGMAYTAISAVLVLAAVWLQINPLGPIRLLFMAVLVYLLIMSQRYLRMFEVAADFPFSAAFRLGMLTTLIGAATSAMFLYLYLSVAGKQLIANHLGQIKELMAQNHQQLAEILGEGAIQKAQTQLELVSPASLAYDDFFWKMIVGLLSAFIFAFIFKRTTKTNTTNGNPAT